MLKDKHLISCFCIKRIIATKLSEAPHGHVGGDWRRRAMGGCCFLLWTLLSLVMWEMNVGKSFRKMTTGSKGLHSAYLRSFNVTFKKDLAFLIFIAGEFPIRVELNQYLFHSFASYWAKVFTLVTASFPVDPGKGVGYK